MAVEGGREATRVLSLNGILFTLLKVPPPTPHCCWPVLSVVHRFEILRSDVSANQDTLPPSLLSLQQIVVESATCTRQSTFDHLLLDGLASSRCLILFLLWNRLSTSSLSTVPLPGSCCYYCLVMRERRWGFGRNKTQGWESRRKDRDCRSPVEQKGSRHQGRWVSETLSQGPDMGMERVCTQLL